MKLFEICIAFAAAIALICAASANDKTHLTDKELNTAYFWHQIETHCVAVMTEANTVKVPTMQFNDNVPPTDAQGNQTINVPEITLKLRCTPDSVAKEN